MIVEHVGHVLFELFLKAVVGLDRSFQRHPKSLIKNFDQLVHVPQIVLADGEIVIKPRRLYVVATVFAMLVTLLFCVAAEALWFARPARGGKPPETDMESMGVFAVVSLIVTFLTLNHLLRGAQMVLRKSGVVVRFRRDRIYIPWSLYAQASDPQPLNYSNYSLTAPMETIDWMVHSRDDSIIAIGQDIRTWPISFKKDGRLILKSMYKAQLLPLISMLRTIGLELNQDTTQRLPITMGMQVADDMT